MKEIDGWVKIKKYMDEGNPVCGECQFLPTCETISDPYAADCKPSCNCEVWHGESKCVYYGDCPFSHNDCQEDEPHYLCPDRKLRHGESKSEWQPIETAPEETPLLLFDGEDVGTGYADKSRRCATHWMPLPSPPQENKP